MIADSRIADLECRLSLAIASRNMVPCGVHDGSLDGLDANGVSGAYEEQMLRVFRPR